MKILIIKLSSLGDVIHTLPVLSPLRKRFPEAHITWVVEEGAAPVLMNHPLIDRVMVFPKRQWRNDLARLSRVKACLTDGIRFVRELRSDYYDLVVDFQGLLKSGLLVAMTRASRKRGFYPGREASHFFLNDRVPYPSSTMHSIERYLTLIESLGCRSGSPKYFIPIRHVHRDKVTSFLEENQITFEKPLVLLHPGTRWESKMWHDMSWGELGDILYREHNCQVVYTGSDEDKALVERIIRLQRFPGIATAGRWNLNELAFLQTQADVVVTPDSGPMHLAAALNTPVVALFGPTDPDRTGPHGSGHRVIVKSVHCRPCFKRTCATKECLMTITPQEVSEAVRASLTVANASLDMAPQKRNVYGD